MKRGLREVGTEDLAAALERLLAPRLAEQLRARAPGHCMRVLDLDRELMVRLARRLRADVPGAQVVILRNGAPVTLPELTVTSTKLVELRNPLPDGSLRPPLMVFLPSGLRAAAEDSFGVATFEEVKLGDVYADLATDLLGEIPPSIRAPVGEIVRRLKVAQWPYADSAAIARFALTVRLNDNDPEAAGAALFELGLVPDFELFVDPTKAPYRIERNRESVFKLTWSDQSERGRVHGLGLSERGFRGLLGDFLAEVGTEDPRAWTRRIVTDKSHWGLSFHRWAFEDKGSVPDSICIEAVTTELPRVERDSKSERLSRLLGQQYLPLGEGGLRKFNVTFRVSPPPARVRGLAKFVVRVLSKETGPLGLARTKPAWKGATDKATVSMTRWKTDAWEEGWHHIQVQAVSADGELIPLVDSDGRPLPWVDDDPNAPPRVNESEPFYVLPDVDGDDDVDVNPTQRAFQRESSLLHARLRLQFTALLDRRDPSKVELKSVAWTEKEKEDSKGGIDLLEVRFAREGAIRVPVSHHLREIERTILANPAGPLCYRLLVHQGEVKSLASEADIWPEGMSVRAFLAARTRYFEALGRGAEKLVTQAVDLRALRPLVVEYATAYHDVIQALLAQAGGSGAADSARPLEDLARLMAIDSIHVSLTDHGGHRGEAALIGPTHPLRALWLVTWAELGDVWLKAASAGPREHALAVRDALLEGLTPLRFPPVLTTPGRRLLAAVDNLHPFWTAYAPPTEEDPRGLVGDLCAALDLPEPDMNGTILDGAFLARRVERYLVQHPYVCTLTLNAFNAGRGKLLADMLLHLQRQSAFATLTYDIRLFVPDPEALGVGEALLALLSAEESVTAKDADAFSTPSSNHIFPKLCLAIKSSGDFRAAPDAYPAHLSMLFDVFPASEVGVRSASDRRGVASVHGLFQDFDADYTEDAGAVLWRKHPKHGIGLPFAGADDLVDLLSTLPGCLSQAAAAVATGRVEPRLRPVLTLALEGESRALVHQVHEVSDWVFTIDRNLGIEFFDHGGRANRPDYLIDYAPDTLSNAGHRLVITSRSVAELEAMLVPVLRDAGLPAEGRHAVAVLDQLRSLSGRLALKLISSPTQRSEALGLALARMYLEDQGVFKNQIVVPLDAHVNLYRVLERQADELRDDVSFRRTDLALFDLDASSRTLTCRLVEVKCYGQVGGVGAYGQLRAQIADQIAQSERVLAVHFDPHRTPVDRPDRLLKTRELVRLLEVYLDRAQRYALVDEESEQEARFFLETMERGYHLAFTRSALVFDFDHAGADTPEVDAGIEYHRVGVDFVRELIGAAAARRDDPQDVQDPERPRGPGKPREPARAPSVPVLHKAAFLGSGRDRSVSWDDLRARQVLGEEELLSQPSPDGQHHSEEARGTPITLPEHDESKEEASPNALAHRGASAGAPVPAIASNEPTSAISSPTYDVLLGAADASPQYGILGEVAGHRVAIDLNQTQTISLFGVQGGGKSYTLGSIVEMASLTIPGVNLLPNPLATVIFHYSPTQDYKPEFTTMVERNSDEAQCRVLRERYGAEPQALEDVILLAPADKVDARRAEYPRIAVHPLKFGPSELQAGHWRFLMGAVGSQAVYIRQINMIMRSLRGKLSVEGLLHGIESSGLPPHLKDLAKMRLNLAEQYLDESGNVGALVRPGRLVIVDLRDELIEKDEALGLFVVLLQVFAEARHEGEPFNKLVVFDEAHKYIDSGDLVAGLVEVVREMRHKGTTIMVASQDPPSVPVPLIELSSQIILHKFNSPAWLKHIQKANAALGTLTPEKMAALRPGEAYVWSSKATDESFSREAHKIRCRPRVTQHGGTTKTAVR